MTSIPRIATTVGLGVLGAGAGVGAVALARKAAGDDNHKLVSGVLAGLGGAATVGAVLARNTRAFGPLLGAGVGLAAAGVIDAVRGGGTSNADVPTPSTTPTPVRHQLKEGDLLPDGIQATPESVYRQGDELRFDSMVGNQGAAPLELALHFNKDKGTSRTTQVIFNEDGTATERDLQGGLRLDERRDHSHLHFDDFVYFQLYRADRDGHADEKEEIDGGVKQSFYITDVTSFDGANNVNKEAAAKLQAGGRVDRDIVSADAVQGISVNYADVYGAGLDGQSLDIKGLAPGRYVLRQSFDPSDEVLEQDEKNNTADTLIEIKADGSVEKLRTDLAPASAYQTLADGRVVIPSVVDSLNHLREQGLPAHED
jgi:hypothetical protein